MSMHGVDFAFNFFQPKGEKNKGELGEASVALRRVSPCCLMNFNNVDIKTILSYSI